MSFFNESTFSRSALCLTVSLFALIGIATFALAQDDAWDLIDDQKSGPTSSFSGDFQSRFTLDTVTNDEYEDVFTNRELLFGKGVFNLSDRLSVTLSGLAEYLLRVNSEKKANGARYGVELEELYADVHLGKVDLRLGHQIVTWGVTDVVAPTDIINSVDMSRIIDTEMGHYKIPNLMARVDYYPGPIHLQGIFIPFFRPAHLDFIGGDWSVLGNRVPITDLAGNLGAGFWGRQFLVLMDRYIPGWDEQLEELLSTQRLNVLGPAPPEDDLMHWEAAAKFGWSAGPTAGSLSYFYGFEDLPSLYFDDRIKNLFQAVIETGQFPTDLLDSIEGMDLTEIIETKYERLHQVGLDFEANVGPSVLRAEGAFVPQKIYYDTALEVVKKPMFQYTVAADFAIPGNLTFNIQMLRIDTLGWNEDLLSDPAYTFLISYLRGAFFEDRFECYAELLYNVTAWSTEKFRDGDFYNEDLQTSAKISYDILQELELGIGVVEFAGPDGSMLGFIHDKSFWFMDLKYSF